MISIILHLIESFFFKKGHTLILLQNNNELRATGGFITKVIDVSFFSVKSRNVFDELDAHKPVKGPAPLMRMLDDGYLKSWTLRDANFDPDFKKSADQVKIFYQMVFPDHPVNMVTALNFSVIEGLLKRIGPVLLNGNTVDSDSLFYFLSAAVSDIDRHDKKALAERKRILNTLAKKIIIQGMLRFWRWPQIIWFLHRAKTAQEIQHDRPGGYRPFTVPRKGDFFSVVDSNFLGMKSNRYLKKRITHQSTVREKIISNEAQVLFEHFGAQDFPLSGVYRSHCRIILPRDAKRIHVESFPEVMHKSISNQKDWTQISFDLTIPPDGKVLVLISYELPTLAEAYHFVSLRQSGVLLDSLQKTVRYPVGRHLEIMKGKGAVHEHCYFEEYSEWRTDFSLELTPKEKKFPVRILFHELIGPQKLLIRFSQAVKKTPSLKNCFRILDKGGKKSYPIKKVRVEEDDHAVVLDIPSLPQEEEQFFTVEMKNVPLHDGQRVFSKKRQVTVVYRSRFFWEKSVVRDQTF